MNWLADFSRRHLITGCLIVFIEVIFYRQYANLNAEFHFWLHGLFGAAIGLTAITIWSLVKRRKPSLSGWEAGVIGHVSSAIPDVLFIAFGVLHMYWMDIFALHISIHFIAAPVGTMLFVFLLTLLAYGLTADQKRTPAIACLTVAGVILTVSLFNRQPIPSTLQQVQLHNDKYAWLCPMWDLDPKLSLRND